MLYPAELRRLITKLFYLRKFKLSSKNRHIFRGPWHIMSNSFFQKGAHTVERAHTVLEDLDDLIFEDSDGGPSDR